MSFSLRIWIMTLVGFSAFTLWIFFHDRLFPGMPAAASSLLASLLAWVFGVAGTLLIIRFHRRAEKLAEKSARDETAIQLAGAVAHELNQPLTIVISTSEIIARRAPDNDDIQPYLERLIDASERMSGIVQKLDHVTSYRTKPYVGSINIVDLDGASAGEDQFAAKEGTSDRHAERSEASPR